MWLDEHGMAFDDPNILGKLRDFLSLIKSPPSLALTAKLMIQSIERKVSICSGLHKLRDL